MTVAVFKPSGKLLALCPSIASAARLFNIPVNTIVRIIVGKAVSARSKDAGKQKLGQLVFREWDSETNHSKSGRS